MKDLPVLLLHLLVTIAKLLGPGGAKAVVADSMLMKQQLLVINRSRRRAPNLSALDRFLFGFWSLLLDPRRIQRAAVVIQPSTLLKFHNLLKQRKYRRLYSSRRRRKPGPRGPSRELIEAIVELKRRNPPFGCSRIAQQINKAFGLDIDKDVVRRVLAAHYRPRSGGGGPSWLTFLGHTKDSLWSVDLFRCESIHLKSHWVLVVMDQFTRRIIGFGAHAGDVGGLALCRMFNTAISAQGIPHQLSSDNDPLFRYHRWRANLRILEIQEIKSVPYTPCSHPFIERLIGTIRREFLDHAMFWNAQDLENKLADFQAYYNEHRTHSARDGDTPGGSAVHPPPNLTEFAWRSHCGGLYQLPVAASLAIRQRQVEDYLSERLPRPATCHMYREVAQRWVNDTGNDVVEMISTEDVREWRGAVLARASAQTWNLYRRHLRALWNHAMRRKVCASNPFADTAPARAPSLRKKTVDSVDLSSIITALRESDQSRHNTRPAWFWAIAIRTFYYTGIRRRQLVELKWEDINFDEATIYLRAASSKTHREWYIPIAEPLLPELENLLLLTTDRIQRAPEGEEQVFNVTLFHERFKGTRMTVDQLSSTFERLSKALKIRITPHRLRHTMATELAARKDIRTLQQMLGHTDIQTTMQYVHPDIDRMRNRLDGMSL